MGNQPTVVTRVAQTSPSHLKGSTAAPASGRRPSQGQVGQQQEGSAATTGYLYNKMVDQEGLAGSYECFNNLKQLAVWQSPRHTSCRRRFLCNNQCLLAVMRIYVYTLCVNPQRRLLISTGRTSQKRCQRTSGSSIKTIEVTGAPPLTGIWPAHTR